MGSIGTFGSFTQARLAIYAAQLGLSVTGNNISNVNTVGYTRQKLEQVSFKTGGADRYHSSYELRIGNGVLPTGVSQLRDPYLDIRFRNDNSSVGAMDYKLGGLEKIAAILDEVGKGGEVKEGEHFGVVAYQLANLFQTLSGLTDQTGQQEYDIQVRTAAASLCQELNAYAANLKELYNDTVDALNTNITKVNSLLSNIRDLNASIRKSDIHGDNALELRDQRNNLIDELSTYIKIDAVYTTEDIGAGKTVEKLIIKLGDANPDSKVSTDESVLIDGRYCTQLGYTQVPQLNPEYEEGYTPNPPDPADIKQYKYLLPVDENGDTILGPNGETGTNDASEAAQVDSPNFDFTLSELRDVYGAIYEEVVKMQERGLDPTNAADKALIDLFNSGEREITKDNGDGTVTVTSIRMSLVKSLVANPAYDPTQPNGPNNCRYMKTDADGNQVPTDSAGEADRETKPYYFAQDYIKTRSTPVDLDDNDLYGALQSQRELLTEAGEFTHLDTIAAVDENAATKRGVPYYQNVLDLLANQIANAFNDANQGYLVDNNGNYITEGVNDEGDPVGVPITINVPGGMTDQDGNPIVDEDGNPVTSYTLNKNVAWDDIPQEAKDVLQANDPTISSVEDYLQRGGGTDADGNPIPAGGAIFKGGNLFSNNGNSDDATGITASNISISTTWSKTPLLVGSFVCPPGALEPASTDSINITENMQNLQYAKLPYNPQVIVGDAQGIPMFTGTFEEMFINIDTILGNDMQITGTLLDNYYEKTVELDSSRAAVSSVDFNDEAMNLMQYAKSYNAACRLMTTLDSVLDKLINGTGLTT